MNDPAYIQAAESLLREADEVVDDLVVHSDEQEAERPMRSTSSPPPIKRYRWYQTIHRSPKQKALCIPSRLIGIAALSNGDTALFDYLIRRYTVTPSTNQQQQQPTKSQSTATTTHHNYYSYSPTLLPARDEDLIRIKNAVQERIQILQMAADECAQELVREAAITTSHREQATEKMKQKSSRNKEQKSRQKKMGQRTKSIPPQVVDSFQSTTKNIRLKEDKDIGNDCSSVDECTRENVPQNQHSRNSTTCNRSTTTTIGKTKATPILIPSAPSSATETSDASSPWIMVSSKPQPSKSALISETSSHSSEASIPWKSTEQDMATPSLRETLVLTTIPSTTSTGLLLPEQDHNNNAVKTIASSTTTKLNDTTQSFDDCRTMNKSSSSPPPPSSLVATTTTTIPPQQQQQFLFLQNQVSQLQQELNTERQKSNQLRELLQSLQLRLYISDTRLTTYETALQDHIEQVQCNTSTIIIPTATSQTNNNKQKEPSSRLLPSDTTGAM